MCVCRWRKTEAASAVVPPAGSLCGTSEHRYFLALRCCLLLWLPQCVLFIPSPRLSSSREGAEQSLAVAGARQAGGAHRGE